MNIRSLGYIGLISTDYKEWVPFGRDILGMPHSDPIGDDDGVFLRSDGRHHRIAIRPGETNGLDYLGWEVADQAALKAAAESLTRSGAALTHGDAALCQQRQVDEMFYFVDSHGYRHELYHRPSISTQYFKSTSDVSAFKGVGHAFVFVPDIQKAEDYYKDVFGFEVSDLIDFGMGASPFEPGPLRVNTVFFRCNPQHHCLAVAKVGADGPTKGLAHFMIEMASMDDVGRTFDRALAAGCAVTTMGRHSNDHMISFYLNGPVGISIECGYGGLHVETPEWEIARLDSPSFWGHNPVQKIGSVPA